MVKDLVFLRHVWSMLPTVQVLVYPGLFGQGYNSESSVFVGQSYQWWKFFFCVFGQGYQRWKLWSLWSWLLLLATDYQHQWWKLCFWLSLLLSNLWHPALPSSCVFAGGSVWHPTVQARVCALEGNCWHGIGSTSISYTSRQESTIISHHGGEAVKRKCSFMLKSDIKSCPCTTDPSFPGLMHHCLEVKIFFLVILATLPLLAMNTNS